MPQIGEPQNPTGRKPKVKPKKAPKPQPYPTTPNATLGGHEVQRTHAEATAVVDPETGTLVGKHTKRAKAIRKQVKAIKAHQQAVKQAEKAGKQLERASKLSAETLAKTYGPGTTHTTAKDPDVFIDPKTGRPDRFSAHAPLSTVILNAATGHDPYASLSDTVKLGAVDVLSAIPAVKGYQAVKAGQEVIRGEQALNTAAKAKKAEEAIKAAADARKAERAAARAKEASKAAKVKVTVKTAAKQTGRRARPTEVKAAAKRKAARSADRAVSGVANPVIPAAATTPTDPGDRARDFLIGSGKAVVEHPLKTFSTTARAIYGSPVALGADAINIARGHGGDVLKEWEAYGKKVGGLFSGDTQKVENLTANQLGVVPHVTIAGGLAKGVTKVRAARGHTEPLIPSVREKRYQRDLKKAAKGDRKAAERVRDYQHKERQRALHEGNRKVAEQHDQAEQRTHGKYRAEMKGRGKRKLKTAGTKKRLEHQTADLRRELAPGVQEQDLLRLFGSHRFDLHSPRLRDELRKYRDSLEEPGVALPEHGAHTRKVIDAVLANLDNLHPRDIEEVLSRWEELGRNRSAETHAMRTGRDQSGPDPSLTRARYLPAAREFGIHTPEEMVPHELRGITSHQPTEFIDSETAIRAEAKDARKKAKQLRYKAAQADARRVAAAREASPLSRKDTEARVRAHRQHADELRAKADAEIARADKMEAVVNRFRRADALDRKAYRIESGQYKAREGEVVPTPESLHAEADALRKQGHAEQAQRSAEYENKVRAELEARGRNPEPIWFPTRDITRADEPMPITGAPLSRNLRKEKLNRGVLERQGRADESAKTLLEENYLWRVRHEEARRQLNFIQDEGKTTINPGSHFGTMTDFERAQAEGRAPIGVAPVPAQELVGAINRHDPLREEYHQAKLRAKATQPSGKQTVYFFPSRHNYEAFVKQTKAVANEWRKIQGVMRVQTIGMLATTPQWAEFQLVATPIQIAMRNPNPAAWVRSAQNMVHDFRRLDPETKAGIRSYTQSNPMDFLSPVSDHAGLDLDTKAATLQKRLKGLDGFLKTPAGRAVSAIGNSIKHGTPLIQAVSKYEAAWRHFSFYLEEDRASGLTPKGKPRYSARVQKFMGSVADSVAQQHGWLRKLEGMSHSERMRYLASEQGRRDAERIGRASAEAIGNYGALAPWERRLSSLIPFYGFLRVSLTVPWYYFPKNNPAKAAFLYNIGQANAVELRKTLNGDPSFFSGWGQGILFGDNGPQSTLDLSRAMPGGNALVQNLGDMATNGVNLGNTTGIFQPVIGQAVTAIAGQTPFGTPLPKDETKGQAFLKGLAGLNAVTRATIRDQIGPDPSKISLLFKAIQESDPTGGAFSNNSFFLPDVVDSVRVQKDAVRLGKLLDKAYKPDTEFPSPSQIPVRGPEHDAYEHAKKMSKAAWKEIDQMMITYGVQTKVQQKKEAKKASLRTSVNQYGNARPPLPGSHPSGDGDSIFGSNDAPVFNDSGSGQSVFGHGQAPVFK